VDLPGKDPSPINASDVDIVENRQHGGVEPHPQGGLKTRVLLEWAEKILLLAHQRHLRILPAFIPSEENLQADAASRFQSLPDWHLSPDVFLQIVACKGLPQVDLFASRRSAQTTRFFSWDAADSPEALDALCQIWDFDLAYLFPPIPLLRRVVRKLEVEGDLPPRHPSLGLSRRFTWWTFAAFPSASTSLST
jgi:hypothetical protein